MSGPRDARVAALVCGAAVLLLGARIAIAPIDVLVDRVMPDDAFYYFQTARNAAAGLGSTFDGLHTTTGYQPLWLLVCALVYLVMDAGGDAPVRVLLALQVLMGAATAWLMARTMAREAGAAAAMLGGAIWVVAYHRATINGLETSLYCLTFAVVVHLIASRARDDAGGSRARDTALLGIATAALCLGRVDALFTAGAVGAWLARRSDRAGRWPAWLVFAAPIGIAFGAYVAMNLALTGHPFPVSGAVKSFHSAFERGGLIASGQSPLALTARNLLWPFVIPVWWAAASVVATTACVIAAVLAPPAAPIRRVLVMWPLLAGVAASYLFYGVTFYGIHSRTMWYYGPLTLVAWMSAAWLVSDAARRARRPLLLPAALAIALPILAFQAWRTDRDLRRPPSQFNYHLLQGARWASTTLPPDATIWSGNAGILGYFSGRRVVNTDGLANDYDFLEQVLKAGRPARDAYARQWDYAIDAPFDESFQARFPEGCFVPLPPGVAPAPFQDGTYVRQLRVFQMKPVGIVNCAAPRVQHVGDQANGLGDARSWDR